MLGVNPTRSHPASPPSMNHTQSIRLAFYGFENKEELAQLSTLFSRAKHWEQPWQIVDELHHADFLLQRHDNNNRLYQHFPKSRIIAYTSSSCPEAKWRLTRPTNNQKPSPLAFMKLLKEAGQYYQQSSAASRPALPIAPETSAVKPPSLNQTSNRLKVLIVGNVGAGKTTAVHALSDREAISAEVTPSDYTMHQKRTTTVGMDFGTSSLNADTQLMIYGTPGQRRFDFMSDILIGSAFGLIILISNEANNPLSDLNYYLDKHQGFLSEHPAVIGITHNDLSPVPSLKDYREFLATKNCPWPIMKVDARHTDDMRQLVDNLCHTAFTS